MVSLFDLEAVLPNLVEGAVGLGREHIDLILPLLLSLWIAWLDLKTRRIPNYLTLGIALAGLGFRLGSLGLPGLENGLCGLGIGFLLLLLPYWKGGMGAGDVKALAALGAWLGFPRILYLGVYMGLAGGVIILVAFWRQGMFWSRIRQGWLLLSHWLWGGPLRPAIRLPSSPPRNIPYGSAMALGMLFLCWHFS